MLHGGVIYKSCVSSTCACPRKKSVARKMELRTCLVSRKIAFFDLANDGERVATMSQKQHKLINVGIDEVNKQKVAMSRCLSPTKTRIGLLVTMGMIGMMLSAPTIAASADVDLIRSCTDSHHEPGETYFECLEAADQAVKVMRFTDLYCDGRHGWCSEKTPVLRRADCKGGKVFVRRRKQIRTT